MPSIRINKVPWHSVSFHSIRLLSFTFSLTSLHTYTLSWIIEFCRLKDSSSRERRNVSSLSDLGHVSWLLDIMWGTEEYIVTLKNETTISLLNELNKVLILHTGDWNHNHREKKELGPFCCLAKAKLSIDYFRCAKLLFFGRKFYDMFLTATRPGWTEAAVHTLWTIYYALLSSNTRFKIVKI